VRIDTTTGRANFIERFQVGMEPRTGVDLGSMM